MIKDTNDVISRNSNDFLLHFNYGSVHDHQNKTSDIYREDFLKIYMNNALFIIKGSYRISI